MLKAYRKYLEGKYVEGIPKVSGRQICLGYTESIWKACMLKAYRKYLEGKCVEGIPKAYRKYTEKGRVCSHERMMNPWLHTLFTLICLWS